MKNLIVMTMVAFAMLTVSAEQFFSIVSTEAYEKDTNPSDKNSGYYSGYLCTIDSVKDYFGGKKSADDVTSYVAENYAKVLSTLSKATAENGVFKLKADAEGYTSEQYAVSGYFTAALASEYIALALYDDGENEAFRVFGEGSGSKFGGGYVFDDATATAGTVGNWQAVPEPTSGLLLLIGMAGLALKRKRA